MSIEYDYNHEPEAEPVPAGAGDTGEQGLQPRESASDFRDERVNRIADVTFNDEDGEGANAEWWDMLASIDADLTRLRELAGPDLPWQDTMDKARDAS